MSEYQYYEFLAIDRPLDKAAQAALRSISERARITSTSFVNHYEWGDLKGDPSEFMKRWFDLHLYFANWNARRLMLRVPTRLVSRTDLEPFLGEIDWVGASTSGDNLIVDLCREEADVDDDDWPDGQLAALAPLRADVLSGDFRMFYLVWLTAVQDESLPDDAIEPLPGIAPLTGALEAFADFFGIDPDLVAAAAQSGASDAAQSKDALRKLIAAIPEAEKTDLLLRVVDGEGHVAAELKNRLRQKSSTPTARRTAGSLRILAREIAEARDRAEAKRREAERRRQAAAAEKARRARIDRLKQRGAASVWREIEQEIERRNPTGYDNAIGLLSDLQVLAGEEGSQNDFDRRLAEMRVRHEKKVKFIERLNNGLGDDGDARLI
ncbi:hypothetical protein JQ604_28290 [Bradyrhizobium jicamae]|uniref:hypothetical protein n=1 Tax=Bradyrhizobium jicamae TaxID=280332 RepID=UPI001BAE4F0E|nr:hypothetical protein [Bradyrhizobium jicamae]